MTIARTDKQRQVEARIQELSESASRRLRIDRRRFLAGTGGLAASFLATNEVFGRLFDVDPIEMFEPAAYAQAGAPRDLFVFDDQLHLSRGRSRAGAALRALALGPSARHADSFKPGVPPGEYGDARGRSPVLVGLPVNPADSQLVQFIKDVYLDSQVTIGLLSSVTASSVTIGGEPPRAPTDVGGARRGESLTAAQTAAARNVVNEISGSTRMLALGLLQVGKSNLTRIQEQIDANKPDSWKGYNTSNGAKLVNDSSRLMLPWRLDDEEVAYPTFDLIQRSYEKLQSTKPGFRNICVHGGLAPGLPDPTRGHPGDMPKAATDWPNLNFHACVPPSFFMYDVLQGAKSGKLREGVPDISWTTEYATLVAPFRNCYAKVGTTWASSIVTFPTLAAHVMGRLMKFLGPDRIVFGSDSVRYGSPQWQIDALWRFQIPEELRNSYGYPELTRDAKRKILGLNSARLYGVKEVPRFTADNLSRVKEQYLAMGASRAVRADPLAG